MNSSYRVISLLLASMMFLTSMTYSVDLHYCKGLLKSFSLIGEAKSCHSGTRQCKNHPVADVDDRGCCSSQHVIVDDLDENYPSPSIIEYSDIEMPLVAVAYLLLASCSIEGDSELNISFDTGPPQLSREFYVLYETYLL